MKFNEKEDTQAYAKIEGKEIKVFINKLVVYIGRELPNSGNAQEQKIYLGNYKYLSRRHLKIFWDSKKKKWFIQNLSKNIIFVDKKKLGKGQKPKKLKVISSIKVGIYKLYFFRAK